jgi:hypothetical protein
MLRMKLSAGSFLYMGIVTVVSWRFQTRYVHEIRLMPGRLLRVSTVGFDSTLPRTHPRNCATGN